MDWVKLIGGGFAGVTAPFAVHPQDKERANAYFKLAATHGITVDEAIAHARQHLEQASGWPTDIDKQLDRVRKMAVKKLK